MGDAAVGQHGADVIRIADAMDAGAKSESRGGLDQVCGELAAALVIAPIADPDQVGVLLRRYGGPKQRRVGRLMPREGALRPAALQIDLADHLAKRQNAVVAFKVK